tara:strand:- start:306 stop:554 length:249 start_codon:yes stop_codon:yes gene_type:complete
MLKRNLLKNHSDMKKYKVVTEDEYLDQINDIVSKFNLSEEEKKEVDIIITEYLQYLQRINSIVEDKSKVKLLGDVVKKILEE